MIIQNLIDRKTLSITLHRTILAGLPFTQHRFRALPLTNWWSSIPFENK
jgi:hypothetical protein